MLSRVQQALGVLGGGLLLQVIQFTAAAAAESMRLSDHDKHVYMYIGMFAVTNGLHLSPACMVQVYCQSGWQ